MTTRLASRWGYTPHSVANGRPSFPPEFCTLKVNRGGEEKQKQWTLGNPHKRTKPCIAGRQGAKVTLVEVFFPPPEGSFSWKQQNMHPHFTQRRIQRTQKNSPLSKIPHALYWKQIIYKYRIEAALRKQREKGSRNIFLGGCLLVLLLLLGGCFSETTNFMAGPLQRK